VLLDEVRAGGRIPLIIGRGLTEKARAELGLPPSTCSRSLKHRLKAPRVSPWRRKWSARPAAVKAGVRPGTYCEPKMTTVGSQDTTGPMTRDELKDLACLGFSPTW
jgi:aconitate hydratase 2/2-methylisocitrate dehydratase